MRIGEVSAKYEISSDTLRYYERIVTCPRIYTSHHVRRNCGIWVD
jgi:DNA-binding transcriptional MerR regulator